MSGENEKTSRKTTEENKVIKYLKYALGEISIVVIGILFVLAANFVREQIRENKFRMNALHALRNDVAKDLKELETYWMPRLKDQSDAHERLSNFLKSSEPITDSSRFLSDIILVSAYFTFNQNSTAIEDLINGNNLELIHNDSLRKALLSYQSVVKGTAESDLIHRAYFTEIHGRIGPKLVRGLALTEGFTAYHNKDTTSLKMISSKALSSSMIRESDYLRELLIATGPPFEIKKAGYILLKSRSESLLRLLDDAIEAK